MSTQTNHIIFPEGFPEDQLDQIERFFNRFCRDLYQNEAHFILLCHAAFPAAINADLLYKIWSHFSISEETPPRQLEIPYEAVSDVLLFPLFRSIGGGWSELPGETRSFLLHFLSQKQSFGQTRIRNLAEFLSDYATSQITRPSQWKLQQSQYWTALAEINPEEAARQMIEAMNSYVELLDKEEKGENRFTKGYAEPERVKLLVELLTPLKDLPVGSVANLTQHYLAGKHDRANELLKKLEVTDKGELEGVKARISRNIWGNRRNLKGTKGRMMYSKDIGWVINYGAIHGINKKNGKVKVIIYLDQENNKSVFGEIDEISPTYSTIITFSADLNTRQAYHVEVLAELFFPLRIFITGDKKVSESTINYLKSKIASENVTSLYLVYTEDSEVYVVRATNSHYTITLGNDNKPLVKRIGIPLQRESGADILFSYLLQMANWNILKSLNNENSKLEFKNPQKLPQYPIELKVFLDTDNGIVEQKIVNNRIEIPLIKVDENNQKYSLIKLQLINHSEDDLFVSLLYMSMLFGVNSSLLPSGLCLLGKDKDGLYKAFVNNGRYLELAFDQYIYDYNWPESYDYLKLFISKSELNIHRFEMDELPPPQNENTRRSMHMLPPSKAVSKEALKEDWISVTYEFNIPNPIYKKEK